MLEAELKQLIGDQGGIRPGVARREAFKDSPPSADMTYLKPWAESANAAATKSLTFGTRGVLDRPKENIKTTCNNCITVCSGPMKRRKELRDLLFRSGVVELDDNGQEVVKCACSECP